MIKRTSNPSGTLSGDKLATGHNFDGDFYRRKLKEALGEGVEALHDPEIEAKVEAYFHENPGYSRDAMHVAAIACRFKKEKVSALQANAGFPQKIHSPSRSI